MLGLKYFSNKKFHSDLALNYLSLIFLGISGIFLNIMIARNYGPSTLGVFNQVLSIYIIVPMICSAGIPYSTLHYLPQYDSKSLQAKSLITSAIVIVIVLSTIFTAFFYYLITPLSILLDSEGMIIGLKTIVPGIFFFSINKVFINGVINGLRRMKRFAIYQLTRYLLILLSLFVFNNYEFNGYFLPIVFTFTESILFIILIIDLSNLLKFWAFRKDFFYWIKKHFLFGIKSIFNGVLVEINSRVDILMIGIYLSDNEVGIYSISALFAEGFLEIFIVIQNNINPIISKFFYKKRIKSLTEYLKKIRLFTYKLSIAIGFISIILYKPVLKLIVPHYLVSNSYSSFVILVIGITISSGYIPFKNLLSMSGFPELNTIYMVSFVLINVIFNFFLIPIFGISGAASSTP